MSLERELNAGSGKDLNFLLAGVSGIEHNRCAIICSQRPYRGPH